MEYITPALIMIIIIAALSRKRTVYNDFIEGASEGMALLRDIFPPLVAMLVAASMIKASGAKYILLHTPRGRKGYFFEVGRLLCKGAVAHHGKDELGDDVLVYMLFSPIYSV